MWNKRRARRQARDWTIDSIRDDAVLRASDLDRLNGQVSALEAENARLRRDQQQQLVALRHIERQFAGNASELATVYASRSWRLARRLRTLFAGRPAAAEPHPAPPVADVAPVAAGGLSADAPAVSLIVAADRTALTLACRNPSGLAFEILFATEDGATPTPPGVRAVVVPAQATVAARYNLCAALARSNRIAFWDGVSRPEPGWLQALDDGLARFPQAGLIGGVLCDSAGRIAAAGATIERDGRLAPLARAAAADHPSVASVAPVDAAFAGCVMLPAEVWRRFGGLDPEIGSVAHAFAELGLRLRGAGLAVLRQPFARLTGTAAAAGDAWADAYGRWCVRRAAAAGGNGLAGLGLGRPPAPRALFVDSAVPTPDRDSGSGDIQCVMRIFVGLGYDVTLLPAHDLGCAGRYVDELRRGGVRVIANGWVRSAADFLAREPQPFDLIMLYRGSLAGNPMLDALSAHSPRAKLVFNAVDLHFLRLEREALLARAPDKLDEAFRVQQLELAAISRADCTVLLSLAERRMIGELLPRAATCVIPIAREITGRRAPFAPRSGVLFIGGFRHRPNTDAILAFCREVWPLVRRRLAIPLMIAGADTPAEVRALHSETDGISVLGHVADLDAALARCRLTVAPLRYGAGIKGKIVSSLAAGVPCVATPIAVEGMGLAEALHVRVASLPQPFADSVVDVHEDPLAWQKLSDAGLQFAIDTFSVAEARRRLGALLVQLGLPAGDADRPGDY